MTTTRLGETMCVRRITTRPETMAHFPDEERYGWLELHQDGEVYGHAAIAERDDALELHVTLTRWGSRVRRSIQEDIIWLKAEARQLKKKRILGIRVNGLGEFDPRLFKFAKLFGFTDMHVFQTTSLSVD